MTGGVKLVNKCPVDGLSARTLSLNFVIDKEDSDLAESYALSRTFFVRILGIVHFFYFLSIFNNVIPLIGSNGLYPVSDVITVLNYELHTDGDFIHYLKRMPILFTIFPANDFFLVFIPLFGLLLSFIPILTGIANWILTGLIFLLLHTCVYSMNTFNFNIYHMIILEVTFLAIFLHQSDVFKNNGVHNIPWSVKWGFRLFVFKVLLGSGIGQLRTSNQWSDTHAIHNLLNMIPSPTSFTWFIDNITANPINDKILTLFVLATECLFSIFAITPIRSCRLLAFFFTTLYSLFFYTLGGNPLFYLVLFASSLFLLDDKAMGWLFANDVADKNYDKPNDDCQVSVTLDNISEHFWNLFHATPKVDEATLTVPLFGNKIRYNDFIRKVVKVVGVRILYIKQLFLTISMVVLLVDADIHWAVYLLIPIMLCIHVLTDLVNFTFAYLTTFSVFILTSLWLFKHLMIVQGTWQGVLIFALFIFLLHSLGKSCGWNHFITKLFFESVFILFLLVGFKHFVNNVTLKYADFNHGLLSYGVYNTVAAYPNIDRYRYELVIIGTGDRTITDNTVWKEYEWKSKPGFINNSPSHIIPYERPLDNWITANHNNFQKLLHIYNKNGDFEELHPDADPHVEFDYVIPLRVGPLLYRLSIGDQKILSLFANNPFPNGAEHLKALIYSYHMSHESQSGSNHDKITQKKLEDMMNYAKRHNFNPNLGKYANYGTWWNRQPLLILTQYDLTVEYNQEKINKEKLRKKLMRGIALLP